MSFLPVLELKGFAFGELRSPRPGSSRTRGWPGGRWSHPGPLRQRVGRALRWSEFQDEAIGYFENPTRLETADPETIRKLLTLHVRKDRFCEGHFLEMLEVDNIQAILRRLATLLG